MAQVLDSEPAIAATGYFFLRTALIPFDALTAWVDDTGPQAEASDLRRSELLGRLRSIVSRPEVQEALLLASTSTYEAARKWLLETGAIDVKLQRTLTKYIERMAGRSTPFGLFAGCSFGRVGACSRLVTSPLASYQRASRLDNDQLFAILHNLEVSQEFLSTAQFWPNSTVYRLGGRSRFIRTTFTGSMRHDNLAAVDVDDFLRTVLSRAEHGATVSELTDHLVASDPDCEITPQEAKEYVRALIEQQLLVSSLSPVVTGPEPLQDAIVQFRALNSVALKGTVEKLERIESTLKAIDAMPIGTAADHYVAAAQDLAELGIGADVARCFQVDLIKPAPDATIGFDVVDEVRKAILALNRVMPTPEHEPLRKFKEAFSARFEQQEVPLLHALDEESGVGFDNGPAEFPDTLLLGVRFPSAMGTSMPWTRRESILVSKLEPVLRAGGDELCLSDHDLEDLTVGPPSTLPDTLSAMVTVSATNSRCEDFTVLVKYASGPSGVNLVGRFCHAEPCVLDAVKQHLAVEEQFRPDVLYAEIVHLPSGRLGNILARPLLRTYEIPYQGRSGAPIDRQISVSDLLISVRDNRIRLRSQRLDREVLPRLTTMHNYARGHAVYAFLCSLQRQNVAFNLFWNWGALQAFSRLPRVTYGRIILARAQWRLNTPCIRSLTGGAQSNNFDNVSRWRHDHKLPRHIALVDGDNELPVDLDNPLSVDAFCHLLKGRGEAAVVEMYPHPQRLAVEGPEGRFVHEIVIPFARHPVTKATSETKQTAYRTVPTSACRVFSPGSEWIYLKWYVGTSNADAVLADLVAPLASGPLQAGLISRWFFVRYSDPDFHLRLRFNARSGTTALETLGEVLSPSNQALADTFLWKVQLDTYMPEIERYGGMEGLTLSEEIFWRDSEFALSVLQHFRGDKGLDARWRLCLRSWDSLMSDMGFTLHEKWEFTKANRDAGARQHNNDKLLIRSLGDKFRRERRSIEAVLGPHSEPGHPLGVGFEAIRTRSLQLQPTMQALREAFQNKTLTSSRFSLASSYLHMCANRLLRSTQRAQEFVLYDFLSRFYESQLARARSQRPR